MTGSFPHFTVHWKTGVGTLLSPCSFETSIRGYNIETSHIVLEANGSLHLRTGYEWDFGSGPAVNNPAMVYASLAHDAFYELMVLGLLPWSERRAVDEYFFGLLKEAGASRFRLLRVRIGVRWGYPLLRFFGVMGRNEKALRDAT